MQEGVNADKSNIENIGEALIAEKDVSKGATESLQNPEEQEDESKYPGKFKLALIVFGLNLSVFCVGLDNTIISAYDLCIPTCVGQTLHLLLNQMGLPGGSVYL